jgi:hypothetical protein
LLVEGRQLADDIRRAAQPELEEVTNKIADDVFFYVPDAK